LPVRLDAHRVAYTRDGALSVDGQGNLVTAAGLLVDPPITVPDGTSQLTIGTDGSVNGVVNGATVVIGSIQLAKFANPAGLEAIGDNAFLATVNSGTAQLSTPGTSGTGLLSSGMLEGANVNLADEMTNMLAAQRAYSLSLKSLQTADELLKQAASLTG